MTITYADSSKFVLLHSDAQTEVLDIAGAKFGRLTLPECPADSSAGILSIKPLNGNLFYMDEKLVFVNANNLGFNLIALIDSAMEDWRREQTVPVESFSESCGDFIVDAMERYGLRNLGSGDATFNREATPEQFRESVFSGMDHWLIRCEMNREPSQENKDAYYRPMGE